MSFPHSMRESVFFLQHRLLAAAVPCLLHYGLPPALHRLCTAAARLFFAGRADNAEAQVIVGDIGVVVDPIAHLAVAGAADPAAAAVIA